MTGFNSLKPIPLRFRMQTHKYFIYTITTVILFAVCRLGPFVFRYCVLDDQLLDSYSTSNAFCFPRTQFYIPRYTYVYIYIGTVHASVNLFCLHVCFDFIHGGEVDLSRFFRIRNMTTHGIILKSTVAIPYTISYIAQTTP